MKGFCNGSIEFWLFYGGVPAFWVGGFGVSGLLDVRVSGRFVGSKSWCRFDVLGFWGLRICEFQGLGRFR